MATNQPTNEPVNQFHLYDIIATEIVNTFNHLIEQLITRRDALLTKIQTMKEDFVTKETTRRAAIEELERVIRQMREESIKVNVNLEAQEKAIQVYRDQMERHQTPTELPTPLFSCPTLRHLQTQIAEFGEVTECQLDYSLKEPLMNSEADRELHSMGHVRRNRISTPTRHKKDSNPVSTSGMSDAVPPQNIFEKFYRNFIRPAPQVCSMLTDTSRN